MTFRLLALCVLFAGAAVLAAGLVLLGELPGAPPEARHLRAMKRRMEVPLDVVPIDLGMVMALPHGAPLDERARIERHAVVMDGWVQRTLLTGDGDVHLELTPAPRGSGGPDTAYVTAEITPLWRQRRPGWSHDRLVEVFRPNRGGITRWDSGPQHVRVTGWLLDDYACDTHPSPWSLQHGAPRVSGWEIHPVTRIERWDDAREGWVEVTP